MGFTRPIPRSGVADLLNSCARADFGSTALQLAQIVPEAHSEAGGGPKANTGSTRGNVVAIAAILRSNWVLNLATA